MAIESSTTTTITRPSTAASLGLLLARLPMGAYFIVAGVGKFRMGVDKFVEMFLPKAMNFMPENLARMYLGALPYIEITLGTLLILGLLTRVVAAIMTLLIVSFTAGATGISGAQLQLPFHPNLIYLGVTLALALCGPGWFSLDGLLFRPRRRVIVTEEEPRVGP